MTLKRGANHMKTFIHNIKADLAAYPREERAWYRNMGFWLTATYRFGMWTTRWPIGLRHLGWLVYRIVRLPCRINNVELWANRRLPEYGSGICLKHAQNIYFGFSTRIGENCLIHHEVTFGIGSVPGNPTIGDRVTIFPGARILGGIVIGDDTVIGANCVVTRNIKPGSVVLPASNQILNRNLSVMTRREKLHTGHGARPADQG